MKGFKNLLLAIATLPFMASCLDSPDSFSQSGFANVSCDYGYANTTKGFAYLIEHISRTTHTVELAPVTA